MEAIIDYLLKSAGVLSIFVLIYHFLLRRLTFFNANRWFLLAGIVASILFPLVEITQTVYVEQPEQTLYIPQQLATPMAMVLEQPPVDVATFDYSMLAIYFYLAIVLFFIGKMIVELSSLRSLILSGTQKRSGKFVLVTLSRKLTPFSFFNYICYSDNDQQSPELDLIIDHEKVHAREWHSIDLLVSHVFRAVFWINPLVWLLKRQIGENLEFIADSKAKIQNKSGISYERTLLSTAASHMQPALANNFFTPFIKKRIVMLQKEASARWNAYKYALILPVIVLFLYSFNVVEEIEYVENESFSSTTSPFMVNQDVIISKFTTKAQLQELENKIESIVDLDYKIISNYDLNGYLKNIAFNYKREGYEWSKGYHTTVTNATTLLIKFNGTKVTLEDDLFTYFLSDEESLVSDEESLAFSNGKEELIYDITSNTSDSDLEKYRKQIEAQFNYQLKFDDLERGENSLLQTISVSAKFPNQQWEKAFTVELAPKDLILLMAQLDVLKVHIPKDNVTLSIDSNGSKATTQDNLLHGGVSSLLNTHEKIELPKDHTIYFTIDQNSTKEYIEEKKAFLKQQYDVDFDYRKMKVRKGKIVRIKVSINDNKGHKSSQDYSSTDGISPICINGVIKERSKSWSIGDCKTVALIQQNSKDVKAIQDSIFYSIQNDNKRYTDSVVHTIYQEMKSMENDSVIINYISASRSTPFKDSLIISRSSLNFKDSTNTYILNNSFSNLPTTTTQIRRGIVTGDNQPLIIIDGVEATEEDLNALNSETIASTSVLKDSSATSLYGKKGKNGVILVVTDPKRKASFSVNKSNYQYAQTLSNLKINGNTPFIILNGKEFPADEIINLDIEEIDKMNVLEGEEATSLYGEKGKNGVMIITTKPKVTYKVTSTSYEEHPNKPEGAGYAYINGQVHYYLAKGKNTEIYNRWGIKIFTIKGIMNGKIDLHDSIILEDKELNVQVHNSFITLSDDDGNYYNGKGEVIDEPMIMRETPKEVLIALERPTSYTYDLGVVEGSVKENSPKTVAYNLHVGNDYRLQNMTKEGFTEFAKTLEDAGHTFKLKTHRMKGDRLVKLKYEINGSQHTYENNKGIKELSLSFVTKDATPIITTIPY